MKASAETAFANCCISTGATRRSVSCARLIAVRFSPRCGAAVQVLIHLGHHLLLAAGDGFRLPHDGVDGFEALEEAGQFSRNSE